jgi:hypothetical protein
MTNDAGTALKLVEILKSKAPEYLDLLTVETEADFDEALGPLLEKAIGHLEANSGNFESLNEVALTAVLAGVLTIPGLSVTQETHSNGHVDLTITAHHCFPRKMRLGEAKIYKGYEYHMAGISQLLDRYSTGRESRGLLIVYFKKANISGLLAELRKDMDSKLPLKQQGPTENQPLKWSFLSIHKHSCGENFQINHIGCNLFT